MTYWPFWLSGLALAAVPIVHWIVVRRMLAVSGRFTRLVDRARFGAPDDAEEMSEEAMIAAIQAMALEQFGEEACAAAEAAKGPAGSDPEPARVMGAKPPPQPLWLHAAFLMALIAGGAISALIAGDFQVGFGLRSEGFTSVFGAGAVYQSIGLVVAGMMVGWGTRMAGGCTSGHGLCGVSRAQKGSLLATGAFFGTGILVALAMDAML